MREHTECESLFQQFATETFYQRVCLPRMILPKLRRRRIQRGPKYVYKRTIFQLCIIYSKLSSMANLLSCAECDHTGSHGSFLLASTNNDTRVMFFVADKTP